MIHPLASCCLLAAVASWALPAHGAQTPASPGGDAPAVLDEITVTARKREVELQEAPVAVSVVTGEDFERAHLVKLDNIDGYVPGLLVTKNDGAGRVASIRGVGWETAQNLSTQPSVLLYVDGIYLANPLAFGMDLAEIQRIEVLRGPQGTEFGQGTTGGALNLVTRKPDFSGRAGEISLTLGSYDLIEGSAWWNVPLGDSAALRLAARSAQHGGFSEIRGGALDGYDLDDSDVASGRWALEWIPSSTLSLRLSAHLYDSDQHGAAQKHVADPNPDPRRLTQDFPSRFALANESYSAVVEWDSPWGVTIRSLSGLQTLRKRQSVDGDRLTEELVSVDLTGFGPADFDLLPFWNNDSRAVSQELHALGDGERWSWTAGLYYLRHANENFFLEAVGPGPAEQFADRLANPSPETLPPFTVPLEFVEDRTLTRRDAAAYGQAVLQLAPRWNLTLGGRFQRDRSTDVATQFWVLNTRQTTDDSAWTWKAGLDLTLTANHLLYALLSTGWKNGGTNPGAANGASLDVPERFAPEEVTALEIGSRNRLAGGRGRVHTTLFSYDYRDFQFIQEDPVPFAAGTGNIPRTRISGLESELSWRLSQDLWIDGQVTWLDGRIESDLFALDVVDFLDSGFGRFTETGVEDRAGLRVNLKGNEPPKLADLTAHCMLTWERELTSGGRWSSRLDWVYRGEYQYRVFNHPRVDTVPSYATLGLYLAYQPPAAPWEIGLRVTNLFDEDGVNSRFTNPFGLHTTSDELIPPRQMLATLRYRF